MLLFESGNEREAISIERYRTKLTDLSSIFCQNFILERRSMLQWCTLYIKQIETIISVPIINNLDSERSEECVNITTM